jgi:hypothetical protein
MVLGIFFVLAQVAASPPPLASPSPSPAAAASPLKEIGHTHASAVCSTLSRNLFPAVQGLMANDALATEGQHLMVQTARDEDTAVHHMRTSEGDFTVVPTLTGGADDPTEMDDYRLANLVRTLAQNLNRIETLLDDPHAFPSVPANDSERQLLIARARLQDVVLNQQALLNVLSGNEASNSANDLRSQKDTIPYDHDMSSAQTPRYTFTTAPEALAHERELTQQSETYVTPAVQPLVAACR